MSNLTSEFDRPDEYYAKIEFPTIGDYREMLCFKDRNTALFELDRSGDKAKLKKRVDELENENAVLRSLIGKR